MTAVWDFANLSLWTTRLNALAVVAGAKTFLKSDNSR